MSWEADLKLQEIFSFSLAVIVGHPSEASTEPRGVQGTLGNCSHPQVTLLEVRPKSLWSSVYSSAKWDHFSGYFPGLLGRIKTMR